MSTTEEIIVTDGLSVNNDSYLENTTYLSINGTFDSNSLWEHVIEDFKRKQLTLNEPISIVLMVLYVPIFITSLIGNVFVLLVIVPNQRMWTVTNNFLVNLAVADLLGTYFMSL